MFAPKYLFHGSPKFLKTIEQREAMDSSGNFENEDFAVFLTSSFLVATAYAFKDQIKKLKDMFIYLIILRTMNLLVRILFNINLIRILNLCLMR